MIPLTFSRTMGFTCQELWYLVFRLPSLPCLQFTKVRASKFASGLGTEAADARGCMRGVESRVSDKGS